MPPKKGKKKGGKKGPTITLSSGAQEAKKRKKNVEEEIEDYLGKIRDEAMPPADFPNRGPRLYSYNKPKPPVLIIKKEASPETILTTQLSILYTNISNDLEKMTQKNSKEIVDDLFSRGVRTNPAFVGDLGFLMRILVFLEYCMSVKYINVGRNNDSESLDANRIIEVMESNFQQFVPEDFIEMSERMFNKTVDKILNPTQNVSTQPEGQVFLRTDVLIDFGVADLPPSSDVVGDISDELMQMALPYNSEATSDSFNIIMGHFNELINPPRPIRDMTEETQRIIQDLRERLGEPQSEAEAAPTPINPLMKELRNRGGFAPVACEECLKREADPSYSSVRMSSNGTPKTVNLCGAECNSAYMGSY